MRVVLQRVSRASVTVGGRVTGAIGRGFLLLAGFHASDTPDQPDWMAVKIAGLRLFPDDDGKMNRGLADVDGAVLVVSQFTLYGDVRKGNRPGFDEAAPKEEAEPLYDRMVAQLREISPVPVETGRFRAEMAVELVNDGPVTILLERVRGHGDDPRPMLGRAFRLEPPDRQPGTAAVRMRSFRAWRR